MQRTTLWLYAATVARVTASLGCILLTASLGAAQSTDEEPNLADLSLEELMAIDMRSYTGVVGGHTHLAGEWMVGYRYMLMQMDGLRSGTDSLSTSEVLGSFPVAPTDMTMQMHMLELMYAPSDEFTAMLMVPYHVRSMDHVTGMGGRFTTRSDGIGDVSLTGLYTFFRTDDHDVHAGLGLSLPTGSVEERDATPMGPAQKLPYPMQLGSGTFDLLPSLTYTGQTQDVGWGAQARATIRLGENSEDYRLGDRFTLTAWGEYALTDWLAVSARAEGHLWRNIHGADPELNPAMVPTADPDRQGGERIDALLGIHLFSREGALEGQRLDLEIGVPVFQDLDGPQMSTELLLTATWKWTF